MKTKIIKTLIFTLLISLFPLQVQAAVFETGVSPGYYKDYAIRTEHFQLEYDHIMAVQADSDGDGIADIVEEIAEYAEYSWDKEVGDLDFESPITSGQYIPLILDDSYEYLDEGMAGATSTLYDGTPYFAIDPWLSDDLIKVTVSHEFAHCIQFGYDPYFVENYQSINFAEGTAVWIEDYVYDDIDDYVYYLEDYFYYTDYSIFTGTIPEGTLFEYALVIWPMFLTEYYGDEDIIVDMWEEYFELDSVGPGGTYTVYTALKNVIEERGDTLADIYQEFTVWNLAHDQAYSEGSTYPDVALLRYWNSYPVEDALPHTLKWPALFGANYVRFTPSSGGDDFIFSISKEDEVDFGVTFVPYSGGSFDLSGVEKNIMDESSTHAEFVFEGASDYDYIYVIISPVSIAPTGTVTFDVGYPYYYSADFGGFTEEDETESTEVEVEIENGGDKEGQDYGENPEGVRGSEDLTPVVLNYDEDSVTLSWNRVTSLDIDYYVVSYGDESGNYTDTYDVTSAWITSATIRGLDSDDVYYFLIEAYSESGSLLQSSEEIAGITTAFSFSDLAANDDEHDAVMGLYELGIIQGYDDGSFDPDGVVNRAELLKILVEGLGISPDTGIYRDCFSDVEDDWYAPYVCYAKEQGWVSGYDDGTFKPAQTVNKVEALKMLLMVFGYELDESKDVYSGLPYPDTWKTAWYAVYVDKAFELGILSEEEGEDFYPENGRTRGEISMELWELMNL